MTIDVLNISLSTETPIIIIIENKDYAIRNVFNGILLTPASEG